MRRRASTLVALTAMVVSGCVALPYATPPVEIAGGVGVAAQNDVRVAVPIRGTLFPGGLLPSTYDRRWEIGAGYGVLLPIDAPTYHGAHLELGYYTHLVPASDERLASMWRIGLRVAPGMVVRDQFEALGFSASLRVTGEYVGFSDGPYGDCSVDACAFGYAWGESSVGLYGDVTHHAIDAGVSTVTVGLIFRIPATAGILFAWVL